MTHENHKLKPVGFFHTPRDMDEMKDYLSRFNGDELIVAQTCAWMMFNLMATEYNNVIDSLIEATA